MVYPIFYAHMETVVAFDECSVNQILFFLEGTQKIRSGSNLEKT